jgi:hypothetical protein
MSLDRTRCYRESGVSGTDLILVTPDAIRRRSDYEAIQNEGRTMVVSEVAPARQAPMGNLIPMDVASRHRKGLQETNLGGLLDIAIEIAEKRRGLLRLMRAALLNREDEVALDYARQLCGVES